MKIIKNTSGRDSAAIKKVFTIVHAYMRKLENRKAPNWKNLRVKIEGADSGGASGRAYYNGHGYNDWDLYLRIPRPVMKGSRWYTEDKKGMAASYTVRKLAWLVYHELMHTYGYKHSQYSNITDRELTELFPDNYEMPAAVDKAKVKAAAAPKWQTKYESALARRKQWLSKQKRATNALKKVETQIKYYERTYDLGE